MPRLIDLTRPLSPAIPPWPGDASVRFSFNARIRDGASCNVGHLSLSVHNGTHADAPYHFTDEGVTIDQVPLDTYVGPVWVIDARGCTTLKKELFAGSDWSLAPRVLVRTGAWTDPQVFPVTWPILDADVPELLGRAGVKLLGLDAPSVDELTSQDLPNHHALHRAGISILENLCLDEAPTGLHELIALPLRLVGADGSPVRAVLRVND
jgi:arylformamidase